MEFKHNSKEIIDEYKKKRPYELGIDNGEEKFVFTSAYERDYLYIEKNELSGVKGIPNHLIIDITSKEKIRDLINMLGVIEKM